MRPPEPSRAARRRGGRLVLWLLALLATVALAGCLEEVEDPRPAPRRDDADGGRFDPGHRPAPGGGGYGSGAGSGAAPAGSGAPPAARAPDMGADSGDAGEPDADE